MKQIVASIVLVLLIVPVAMPQSPDLEKCREDALRFCKRIESVSAMKMHGAAVGRNEKAEVWFESRGESLWFERVAASGTNESERKASLEKLKRIAEVGGVVDRSKDSFNGSKVFSYLSLQLELRIEEKPYFQPSKVQMAFFPKRWVSFDDATHVPLVRFSALLGIDSRVKITREENETLIRFTEKSELPAENRFCENRWIDVDPLTGCVIGYGYSGGVMGTQNGQLKWKKNGSDWYASEGTITTNGIVDVHWTIDECTYDAKAVRKSFEIKDSDVPFATRITENANSTQKGKGLGKTRFVGGDEGKREHDLRIAAMRIESAKK